MVITEEIIAAYVEGKVSDAERKEVRRYLAVHPEMQDLVLALMDDSDGAEIKERKASIKPLQAKQSYSDIAFASAAFAPRMIVEASEDESREDLIKNRRKRMSAFWDELKENR
jgi:anti-sigma factor RsiW